MIKWLYNDGWCTVIFFGIRRGTKAVRKWSAAGALLIHFCFDRTCARRFLAGGWFVAVFFTAYGIPTLVVFKLYLLAVFLIIGRHAFIRRNAREFGRIFRISENRLPGVLVDCHSVTVGYKSGVSSERRPRIYRLPRSAVQFARHYLW